MASSTTAPAARVTVHVYPLKGTRGVTVVERATAGDVERQTAYVRLLPPAAQANRPGRYVVGTSRRGVVTPATTWHATRPAAMDAALALVEAQA